MFVSCECHKCMGLRCTQVDDTSFLFYGDFCESMLCSNTASRAKLHVFSQLVGIHCGATEVYATVVKPIDAFPCMYHQLVSAVPVHQTIVGKAMQRELLCFSAKRRQLEPCHTISNAAVHADTKMARLSPIALVGKVLQHGKPSRDWGHTTGSPISRELLAADAVGSIAFET